jgi:sugar fermentation stimulation protein A
MVIREHLREARLIKRYKRFFADVEIDGQTVVAHVPNTGSLKTCLYPGSPCIVSESTDPKRKLKATLHFVQTPSGWAGVNTSLPNQLVYEAWSEKRNPEWDAFRAARREYRISKESRIDLVLADDSGHLASGKRLHHIEVKNVTYAEGSVARFPDAVTERGQKHLRELMRLKSEGHGAELVFVVQREGVTAFAPADDIDPVYGRLLREAREAGVTIRAYACEIKPQEGVTLNPQPLLLKF